MSGAGKTAVLEALKTKYSPTPGLPPDQIVPTVGLNLARLDVPSANGTCVFWDLGGRVGLRKIWERFYAGCDALVFVVDASEETSGDGDGDGDGDDDGDDGDGDGDAAAPADVRVHDEASGIAVLRHVLRREQLSGAPVLVLVNKADVASEKAVAEVRRKCETVVSSSGIDRHRVLDVVGKTGRGVDKGVEWLVGAAITSQRTKRRIAGESGDD